MAELYRAGYAQVSGFPGVEGKNRAANLALELGTALLLLEDDILADTAVWARAMAQPIEAIRLATTRCRNGTPNTKFDPVGTVLASGTAFVVVPHAVLRRLPEPRFKAYDFGVIDGELLPRGENGNGLHSDIWFWHQVRQLDPRPAIEVIGEVTHLKTPLNSERHDLVNPNEVRAI